MDLIWKYLLILYGHHFVFQMVSSDLAILKWYHMNLNLQNIKEQIIFIKVYDIFLLFILLYGVFYKNVGTETNYVF